MIFWQDVFKRTFYVLLFLVVCLSVYLAYKLYYYNEVNAFMSSVHSYLFGFINGNKYLKHIYESIINLTWKEWAKIGFIVLLPIFVVFIIIQNETGTFRKKQRTVDYQRKIKGWWK